LRKALRLSSEIQNSPNANAEILMENSRGGAETRRDLDDVTGTIVDAAIKLHRTLGPGLMESIYEAILARDLARCGLKVERQKRLRFTYDGMEFDEGLRLDLQVENQVVVELKSVERLAPVHKKQLLTYLRLSNQPVGLLINFGAATLKEGLHRIVHNLPPSASPRLRVNQNPALE
jgi:iron complex transport system substrate-binding protein